MVATFTTKQQAIAPTVESPPARRATTTTTVMTFALGATKPYAKQKVTTITRVTAETATKFPLLPGFTTFLTSQQKLPIKVAIKVAVPNGIAPAPKEMAYTAG